MDISHIYSISARFLERENNCLKNLLIIIEELAIDLSYRRILMVIILSIQIHS
jgi:hypothetical protein